MTDYKTITDYNTKAQLELIDKQAKLLERMMKPTVFIVEKTLRDEFAMAALTALLSKPFVTKDHQLAKDCYDYADAMMEARK